MLKDKYPFKMAYNEWVQVCAHLKAPQVNAVIEPHRRSKGRRIQLFNLAVLKTLTNRLDVKLALFKSEVQFSIKAHEALAIIVANDHGLLQYNLHLQQIINQIDRQL